jgi:predicted membrane-bound mannosyltransferase
MFSKYLLTLLAVATPIVIGAPVTMSKEVTARDAERKFVTLYCVLLKDWF